MNPIPTLVVDDEPQVREVLRTFLSAAGCDVETAENGRAALERMGEATFPLVVTDLRMPRMGGLDLLAAIQDSHPETAVVVVTGHATVENTVEALRLGAFDFIEKPFASTQIEGVVERFRRMKTGLRAEGEDGPKLVESAASLRLPSDPAAAAGAAQWLTRDLCALGLASPAERESVRLSLHEAILNAVIHGNLGIASELRADPARFDAEVAARRADPEHGGRKVLVGVRADARSGEWTVEDEGEGFDPGTLADPTDPESLLRVSGRGLLIIRLTMSEVEWNGAGNRIRMVWRKPEAEP